MDSYYKEVDLSLLRIDVPTVAHHWVDDISDLSAYWFCINYVSHYYTVINILCVIYCQRAVGYTRLTK